MVDAKLVRIAVDLTWDPKAVAEAAYRKAMAEPAFADFIARQGDEGMRLAAQLCCEIVGQFAANAVREHYIQTAESLATAAAQDVPMQGYL